MTEISEGGEKRKFLLVKRGLYYRPNRSGYTGVKDYAGRYLASDASPEDGVEAVHEDDAPEYSKAAFADVIAAHASRKIAALKATIPHLDGYAAGIAVMSSQSERHDQVYTAGFAAGQEAAARFIEKRMDNYIAERGIYDPSTGCMEFPGDGDEWVGEQAETAEAIRLLPIVPAPTENAPIPMILHCPSCGLQHVDTPLPGWDNPPHRSHLCHNCGAIWRPADVATIGVVKIRTQGAADNVTPASERHPNDAAVNRAVIQLNPVEIQSGLDRVKWAEMLIRQLPKDHDGRNSWLLNYGSEGAPLPAPPVPPTSEKDAADA